jgi:hypothetical protein
LAEQREPKYPIDSLTKMIGKLGEVVDERRNLIETDFAHGDATHVTPVNWVVSPEALRTLTLGVWVVGVAVT